MQVCKTSRFKTNLVEFTNNQIKPDIAISTIYCYILGFFNINNLEQIKMDLTAKELIELTKEIDEKCIDFAQFITGITHKQVEGYFYFYYNSEWKSTNEVLEIFKKNKGL